MRNKFELLTIYRGIFCRDIFIIFAISMAWSAGCGLAYASSHLVAPLVVKQGYGLGAEFQYSTESLSEARAGQKVAFIYDGPTSQLAGFRLYERKPGDSGFTRVSEFTDLLSVGGSVYRVSGSWSLGRVSGTNSWLITRIVPEAKTSLPLAYYGPASAYRVGAYSYYLTAIDAQNNESAVSQTTNAHFLGEFTITSPTYAQSPMSLAPMFNWSIPSGWPQERSGFIIRLYKKDTKEEAWVGVNPDTLYSKKYDGPSLQENTSYTAHVYFVHASYSQNPLNTYLGMPKNVETFMVSALPPPALAPLPPPPPPPVIVLPLPSPVLSPPPHPLVAPAKISPPPPSIPKSTPPPPTSKAAVPPPPAHTSQVSSSSQEQHTTSNSVEEITPEKPEVPKNLGFFSRIRRGWSIFWGILLGN